MSKGIWDWKLVTLILTSAYLLFGSFLFTKGFTEESVRLIIRWSARLSISCFLLVFGGSAIHKLLQNSFSFWIFRNRKFWGISFACLHLTHLAALIALQRVFHPVFEIAATFSLIVGGGAYCFIIFMLITSFERFRNLLTFEHWKLLYTIGGYWIFVVFFSSYFKAVFLRGEYWDLLPFSALLVVLGLRIWNWLNSRKVKSVSL